jgi:hypothetical protein
LSDDSLEKLRTVKSNKQQLLTGCTNYEILNNIYYAEKFQFLSMDLRYETMDDELSDMVTRAIYICPHNNYCDAAKVLDAIRNSLNTQICVNKVENLKRMRLMVQGGRDYST